MKTSTKLKSITLIALLGAAMTTPLLAQPGPGMGMGGGAGMQNGGPGAGQMGPGMGGMHFGMLLSPEERMAFQAEMRAVKTYDECKLVQEEHRQYMEALAKEKGITLPAPRQNRCDHMKARGFFK